MVSVLKNRVTIIQHNQPLTSILNQLSWQAGVYFSYDANLIDADKTYSIEAANKSLFTVLNQLFDSKNYKLSELQNQVIISKKSVRENRVEAANDTIPEKFFFLTGKIIDNKKEEPIPYASVSLFNKPCWYNYKPGWRFSSKNTSPQHFRYTYYFLYGICSNYYTGKRIAR